MKGDGAPTCLRIWTASRLGGELFRPLRNLAIFNQVRVDLEVFSSIWPKGADFDPATLHEWPIHASALAERVRLWELAAVRQSEMARNASSHPFDFPNASG